jgi:hypothetical protein
MEDRIDQGVLGVGQKGAVQGEWEGTGEGSQNTTAKLPHGEIGNDGNERTADRRRDAGLDIGTVCEVQFASVAVEIMAEEFDSSVEEKSSKRWMYVKIELAEFITLNVIYKVKFIKDNGSGRRDAVKSSGETDKADNENSNKVKDRKMGRRTTAATGAKEIEES